MKMWWRCGIVSLLVLLPAAPGAAQEVKIYPLIGPAALSPDGKRLIAVGEDAGSVREQYEEIEILARLLDRGLIRDARLGSLTDSMGSVAFSPDGKVLATNSDRGLTGSVRLWDASTGKQIAALAATHFSGAEGVYLKGRGIVYSLTLPLHFRKAVADPDKPAPKEPTEWERIRRELRGEKVEAAKPREPRGTSIADAVLKVLADNGKNLTRLPEGESVTVAITLRSPQACANCHSGPGGGPMRGGMSGMGMSGGMGAGGPSAGSGSGPPAGGGSFPGNVRSPGDITNPFEGGGAPSAGGGGQEVDTSRAEFRKYTLLGDLAMKQHNYNQAIDAFMKASAVYKEPPHEKDALLEVIETGSKLARALMAQGKKAEADRVVQSVAKMTERLASGATPPKAADGKSQMPLPAKLIIKVSKKDLDLIGSGKIDFTAFRKEASVEYLNFDK